MSWTRLKTFTRAGKGRKTRPALSNSAPCKSRVPMLEAGVIVTRLHCEELDSSNACKVTTLSVKKAQGQADRTLAFGFGDDSEKN
ncbi:hypothetical protein OJAV_G00046300 [Oryzias javanicus]|uniref:Uncharacterized protein n=1 Tax=Oryzias javanicus TaxID=123683 RepID=A0A3S2UKL2_ORYJA|nr:hypothetical protein OJAV_G00046300 [Oryzias javanicus]